MAEKIKIRGRVLYNDATPADNATVEIWDEDGILDGVANDDRVLRKTTEADGTFAGSGYWQDGIGPDFLMLRFMVNVDGRQHKGPFVRIDDEKSVPIALPWGPPKPVTKSERELVQVLLVADYEDTARDLYDVIEVATEGLTSQILGGSYKKITFVKNAAATLANVIDTLNAATGRPGVEAVDLIWSTHGLTNQIVLADGNLKDLVVREAFESKMSDAARAKLRVCFSTACFGKSHLDLWTAVGFSDASGSKKVYADSALSYAPFLATWAAERTFAEAVAAANAADALDVADEAARAYYRAKGTPRDDATARMIDSTRVRVGIGATRIYSKS